MTRRLRLALLVIVLAGALGGTGVTRVHAQCPEVPPYVLLPASWPCPVIPACGTQYGLCRWPFVAYTGQACQCQASNGAWLPGTIFRGSDGR
jgi:hypothetical protein